jgi:hypothetical protein
LDDSKEIEVFDKMSAIRYAKNLPQEDYTRYDQIRSDRSRDNQKRDKIRTEARGEPTEAFVWHSCSEY